jgi:eukaryotic-like serine/threonine-protein kinase
MSISLKEWGLALLLVLIIFLSILGIFDRLVMPSYTRHGKMVEIPDVVEMPLAQADSTLNRSGFELVVESGRYDNHYPEGTVIDQNPHAFSDTKPGRRVYVTVSSGEQMCMMPNLIGKSERDAVFTAHSSGLDLKEDDVGYEYSYYYPTGVIMAQSIPPGTKLKKDTPLHVTSSLGALPEEFTIPNLIGQPLDRATKIVLTSGLALGQVSYTVNEKLLPNTVIEQSPAASSHAETGQSIDLVVSKLK